MQETKHVISQPLQQESPAELTQELARDNAVTWQMRFKFNDAHLR